MLSRVRKRLVQPSNTSLQALRGLQMIMFLCYYFIYGFVSFLGLALVIALSGGRDLLRGFEKRVKFKETIEEDKTVFWHLHQTLPFILWPITILALALVFWSVSEELKK